MNTNLDVAVIGGGPAGQSAALILGRSRRTAAVFDAGTPRNAAATHVHSFLTRDGTPPAEMRKIARAQAEAYGTIEYHEARVQAISGDAESGFVLTSDAGTFTARRILLAMGMIDVLPDVPGLAQLWQGGQSVFHCPFCHGWEVRDRPWALLAANSMHAAWAKFLLNWSPDITVFTNGAFTLEDDARTLLNDAGIPVIETRIRKLWNGNEAHGGSADVLHSIELEDDRRIEHDVLYIRTVQRQTQLVHDLQLQLREDPMMLPGSDGFVVIDEMSMQTSRPGVFAAGDLTTAMQQAVVAAAAGLRAAASIQHGLSM